MASSRCELAVCKTLGSGKLYKIDHGAHEFFTGRKTSARTSQAGLIGHWKRLRLCSKSTISHCASPKSLLFYVYLAPTTKGRTLLPYPTRAYSSLNCKSQRALSETQLSLELLQYTN